MGTQLLISRMPTNRSQTGCQKSKEAKKQVPERMEQEEKSINRITGFVIAGICDNEEKLHYRKHQRKHENTKTRKQYYWLYEF